MAVQMQLRESLPVTLDGWPAQSGSVNAPAAFSDVLFLTVPAGTYTVNWTVSLSGTPGAGDANNFRLILNGVAVAISVNAGAVGSYPQAPVLVTLASGAGNLKIGTAGNAGTAGSVYGASVPTTGGGGTARLRPVGPREFWLPDAVAVSASSTTNEASCKIYAGPSATQQYFVDGTLSGSTGDSTGKISGHVIGRTQDPYIFCVWSGGDPGATAAAVVTGTKELR